MLSRQFIDANKGKLLKKIAMESYVTDPAYQPVASWLGSMKKWYFLWLK